MKFINSKPVEKYGIQFDSTFELNVYESLRAMLPRTSILVHHKIRIKRRSMHFPERFWKCDFYVPQYDLYVEAKGRIMPDWRRQLELLDIENPMVLDRLIVVAMQPGILFKGATNGLNFTNESVSLGNFPVAVAKMIQGQRRVKPGIL